MRGLSVIFLLSGLVVCSAGDLSFDPSAASLDEVLFYARQYGSTEQKRTDKAAAKKELAGFAN